MPVQPEDHQSYLDFAKNIAQKLDFEGALPKVVWHYTTASGLLGILESGSVFSTQLACLNDQTELRYTVTLVRSALLAMRHMEHDDQDIEFLLDMIQRSATVDTAIISDFYVSCFSEKCDDLSQWRAYGGGENGYAIGFHTQLLISAHSLIARVNYNNALHQKIAAEVAAAFLHFFKQGLNDERSSSREEWIVEFASAWDAAVGQIGPMVKDPAFSAEAEYRCIHKLGYDEGSKIVFRQKQGLLARHLPLVFPPASRPTSRLLPIVEIIVGPCRHPAVSKASIDVLLQQNGYANLATSRISSIPFQVT